MQPENDLQIPEVVIDVDVDAPDQADARIQDRPVDYEEGERTKADGDAAAEARANIDLVLHGTQGFAPAKFLRGLGPFWRLGLDETKYAENRNLAFDAIAQHVFTFGDDVIPGRAAQIRSQAAAYKQRLLQEQERLLEPFTDQSADLFLARKKIPFWEAPMALCGYTPVQAGPGGDPADVFGWVIRTYMVDEVAAEIYSTWLRMRVTFPKIDHDDLITVREVLDWALPRRLISNWCLEQRIRADPKFERKANAMLDAPHERLRGAESAIAKSNRTNVESIKIALSMLANAKLYGVDMGSHASIANSIEAAWPSDRGGIEASTILKYLEDGDRLLKLGRRGD